MQPKQDSNTVQHVGIFSSTTILVCPGEAELIKVAYGALKSLKFWRGLAKQ